jgi:hypothetical protein
MVMPRMVLTPNRSLCSWPPPPNPLSLGERGSQIYSLLAQGEGHEGIQTVESQRHPKAVRDSMNYRVDWTEEADQQLAAVWTMAGDRTAVAFAALRIEQRLGLDPLTQGEARDDFDIRILFDGPLGVMYRVDVFARTVVVVPVGASRSG